MFLRNSGDFELTEFEIEGFDCINVLQLTQDASICPVFLHLKFDLFVFFQLSLYVDIYNFMQWLERKADAWQGNYLNKLCPFFFSIFFFSWSCFNKHFLWIPYLKIARKSYVWVYLPFISSTVLRACLHGGGGPQAGEVTRLGGVTRHVSI